MQLHSSHHASLNCDIGAAVGVAEGIKGHPEALQRPVDEHHGLSIVLQLHYSYSMASSTATVTAVLEHLGTGGSQEMLSRAGWILM